MIRYIKPVEPSANDSDTRLRGRNVQFAYAAATWAFIFAGITFYWAAGGTAGASTVGSEVTSLASRNWAIFAIVLWVDAISKVLLGLLALAIVQSWGTIFPRKLLLVSSWVIGLLMALYGSIQLTVTGISALLMITGVISISPSVDWAGIEGHLAIWDPYWLLGGLLFLLAAKSAPRPSARGHQVQLGLLTIHDSPQVEDFRLGALIACTIFE